MKKPGRDTVSPHQQAEVDRAEMVVGATRVAVRAGTEPFQKGKRKSGTMPLTMRFMRPGPRIAEGIPAGAGSVPLREIPAADARRPYFLALLGVCVAPERPAPSGCGIGSSSYCEGKATSER